MAGKPEWYGDAVRLGLQYNVDIDAIAVAYVEGLLSSSDPNTAVAILWDKFNAEASIGQLQTHPEAAVAAIVSQVVPNLAATDLEAWLFVYQLADRVSSHQPECHEGVLTAAAHVRILEVLIDHGITVAYPRVVDGENAISELASYLQSDSKLDALGSVAHLIPWEGGVIGDRLRTEPLFLQAASVAKRSDVSVARDQLGTTEGRVAIMTAVLATTFSTRFRDSRELLALFKDDQRSLSDAWEKLCRATAADGSAADAEALGVGTIRLKVNGTLELKRMFTLSESVEGEIADMLRGAAAIRFCVTSQHNPLRDRAILVLRSNIEDGEAPSMLVDEVLTEMLVVAGLVPELRGCAILTDVFDCVARRCRGSPPTTEADKVVWNPDTICRKLVQEGAWLDAAALLLRTMQVHPTLRTIATGRALLVTRGLLEPS